MNPRLNRKYQLRTRLRCVGWYDVYKLLTIIRAELEEIDFHKTPRMYAEKFSILGVVRAEMYRRD